MAISNAKKETVVIYKKAIANFVRATNFFNTKDKKIADKVSLKEDEHYIRSRNS